MYRSARIKLTLLYTGIFLVLFWGLSFGVYFWMNRYFGDEQQRHNFNRLRQEHSIPEHDSLFSEPVPDVIMDKLLGILLLIDAGLLLSIPVITWFLTGKTLSPIQEANEREQQFLTDASHDLRTPLTILSAEIDQALEKPQSAAAYKKWLQSNKEEVNHMIVLVEQMLFFAREKTTGLHMAMETIDLTDLITDRVATFQSLARERGLSLRCELGSESIIVWGDATLLRRMIGALLDNAVKYTQKNGTVTASLTHTADHALIHIVDTGVGISTHEQTKVFDRLYRARAPKEKTHGYGLGLTIAQSIARRHKGTISLRSIAGTGTTITVTLPRIRQNRGKNQS